METRRNFGEYESNRPIRNKEDREATLRHIESFIKSKELRRTEYSRVAKSAPYSNIRSDIEYIMTRENECLKEARELRNIIESDKLGEVKLRKTDDFQAHGHSGVRAPNETNAGIVRDILTAALTEDKDMIDRLKLMVGEYGGTLTEKVAKHLMDMIISTKNDITERLLKLEREGL